jgi:anthranilate phosphoribosyltransferase
MLSELIKKVQKKEEVSSIELEQLVADLVDPEITIDEKAAFLVAFQERGETSREIADLAAILRSLALDPRVDIKLLGGLLLDTCGTGGDRMNTFNASTAAAFILASANLPVAKHGNRSITSQCGSADVLEALGINIEMPPETVQGALEQTQFAFLFAPAYHKIFKTLQPLRQYLAQKGLRTVFNILGPLINPARPNIQVVGVYEPHLTEKMGEALKHMGLMRAVVVHGYTNEAKDAGLDEFSNLGPNRLGQLHSSGTLETIELDLSVVGLKPAMLEELKGGDHISNAAIIEGILKGEIQGAQREFVLFNASAGLVLGNLATDLKDGIAKAAEEIDSGRAWKKVEQVRAFTRSQAVARKPGKDEKPVRVKIDTDWIRLQKEQKQAEAAKRSSSIHSGDRLSQPTQLLKPPIPPKKPEGE